MEELENTLNANNPIIIAQIFSKVVKNIKDKHKLSTKFDSELKFLKNKCLVPDPAINEVACVALMSLVRDNILPVESTLEAFSSIHIRYNKSLITLVASLLKIGVQNGKDYRNAYRLWHPRQHLYITIIQDNPDMCNYILNEIKLFSKYDDCEYVTQLFWPVFLYALCNPFPESMNLFKQNTWNFICKRKYWKNRILFQLINLMQVETKNNVEENSELISEAITQIISSEQPNHDYLELLILSQVSLLHHLAVNKLDLRSNIFCLKSALKEVRNLMTVNYLLLILTKTITICSSVYLSDVLNLCKTLLSYNGLEIYVLETLKASLLYWLASPSILITEANEMANDIFKFIENYKCVKMNNLEIENFLSVHRKFITSNKLISTSAEICSILPYFEEEANILRWIENVEHGRVYLISDLYYVLCGLFVSKRLKSETVRKVFRLILKHTELNKELSTQLLTLILYKLSNSTDPNLHFELIKALPKMIVMRENIPKVMAVLLALSKGSVDLYNFSLSLMYEAWKVDNKCYSYLENMLIQSDLGGKKWETYVTKAFILNQLCERKPELYGKDMVAHFSKILNECNDDSGSLPCAMAIDGIRILCKSEIIDVVTTWATLSPKFKNDERVPVIKSLCLLIHEIPHLPYTESCVDLQEEVVRTLWNYLQIGNPEVTEAALNALTSFSLEQICSHLPEQYLDANIIQEREKNVVGIPQTVPGKIWVKFLIENGASKEAGDFLIKMVSIEIAGYLKYVYQVKGPREPINYDYLPTHSIVRGLGVFIKTWASKWKHSIHDLLYIECLRIFSTKFSKPLPPLDWCFLQELLHDPRVKNYCIDIASHQAILSGTARRLMENYIEAIVENPQADDILNVMRNIRYLANSIQPIILIPFFETALTLSIDMYEKNNRDLLKHMIEFSCEFLQDTEIQETNKIRILQVLVDKILITDVHTELFNMLLKCVILLPNECVDKIANFKYSDPEECLEKATKIRCSIASNANVVPLVWLNDIIDVSSKMRRNNFIFQEITKVFRKQVNNASECAMWLLDGTSRHIEAIVADNCSEEKILYFLDIFISAVLEFSGYSTFIMEENDNLDIRKRELFPQAFNSLLSMTDWSVYTSEALNWLFYMNTKDVVSSEYRNIFGLSLWALRHNENFIKNDKWMEYLSSNVITDIR